MGSQLQFSGLVCDQLARQGPICQWAIDPEFKLVHIRGDSRPVLGRPAEELQGRCLGEVLPAGTLDTWIGHVRMCLDGESFSTRDSAGATVLFLQHFPLRAPSGEVILAGGVAQDVTVLMAGEDKLRHSTVMIMKARESERNRLAQFLHDEAGQLLSVAGMRLDLMRMDFEAQVPALAGRTAEIQQLLEAIMERVREFSNELNPPVVERAGLRGALDRLAGRVRRTFKGTLRLTCDPGLHIPAPVSKAFYEIAREAVENAVQHAECSSIEMLIKSTRAGLTIEIRDNGPGFDPGGILGSRRGLGLLIMKHWAGEAGLRLTIKSDRSTGTVIRAVSAAGADQAKS